MDIEQRAQDGYAAYGHATGNKNYRGEPMPVWGDLGERIQGAWMAAARAIALPIADQITPCAKHTWLLAQSDETARESLTLLQIRNCPNCKLPPTGS